MTGLARSIPDTEAAPDFQAISADIAALKNDIAGLMRHLKLRATEGADTLVRDAAGHVGDEALRAYQALAGQGERSVKAIGRQIEAQPVMSLLLAFAAGFLGSRLLAR
ncbi:MAG TPA: hypothetical protein VET85_13505 [Stellaceae bacterium]|nr:hypothetical protein [Stellaceae bacterium]